MKELHIVCAGVPHEFAVSDVGNGDKMLGGGQRNGKYHHICNPIFNHAMAMVEIKSSLFFAALYSEAITTRDSPK